MSEPPPPQPAPPSPPEKIPPHWIGVVLGMIPVVVAWVGLGLSTGNSAIGNNILVASLVLYALVILGAVVCLTQAHWRNVGYGLLSMIFIGPVVWCAGCVVILVGPHG